MLTIPRVLFHSSEAKLNGTETTAARPKTAPSSRSTRKWGLSRFGVHGSTVRTHGELAQATKQQQVRKLQEREQRQSRAQRRSRMGRGSLIHQPVPESRDVIFSGDDDAWMSCMSTSTAAAAGEKEEIEVDSRKWQAKVMPAASGPWSSSSNKPTNVALRSSATSTYICVTDSVTASSVSEGEDAPEEESAFPEALDTAPGTWCSLLSATPRNSRPNNPIPFEEVKLKRSGFTYAVPCVAGKNRLSFFGHVDILDPKAQAAKSKSDARAFMLMADEDCSSRITLDEWVVAGLHEPLFHQIDTDGSGDLDLAEVEAAFEQGIIHRIPGVLW